MITRLFTLTLALGLSSVASAVAPDTHAAGDDLVKVTAVTQFVEGRVQKTEAGGARSDLQFQTPLYEGDRVDTTAGTALKVATRNGCIFVLRGEGTLVAPVDAKAWRVRRSSVRILCEGRSANETFGVANLPLVMKNGEVLFVDKRVMLVDGAASYMGHALALRKLYAAEGNSLKEVSPQPNESDLRELNVNEKPPREAYDWPAKAPVQPEKVYTSRFMLGPVMGGDGVIYDNTDYAQGGLRGGGGRLQLHFKRSNDTSLIVALTTRESGKYWDETGPFSPPPLGAQNTVEFHTLEIGLRQAHDRWWSPFVRAGLGAAKAKIGYSAANAGGGTSYSRYAYEFYVVNATWGLDAHLTPRFLRPFGLYASAEATVVQSFHRGARQNENAGSFQTYTPDEPWRLSGFDVLASAGLEVDF